MFELNKFSVGNRDMAFVTKFKTHSRKMQQCVANA